MKRGIMLGMTRTGVLAAVLAMTAVGAQAQLAPGMTDGPIDITGDRLEVVDDVATWTGNVRAVQGEAILTAERLVADLDDQQSFTKIRALGTIRYSNGKEQIAGEQAVFDDVARTVTITGDVVVTQGEQVMTGGELVYWVDTGRILFTAPEGKRIRGVFHTKQSGESS